LISTLLATLTNNVNAIPLTAAIRHFEWKVYLSGLCLFTSLISFDINLLRLEICYSQEKLAVQTGHIETKHFTVLR
jgi:hypothetical protein